MKDAERAAKLLARTTPGPNGCRLWSGCTQANGYGRARVRRLADYVHRHVFRLVKGAIPAGHDVRHTCDVRNCIEPDHLITGTRLENMRDAVERGRMARGSRLPQTKVSDDERAAIVARASTGEKYAAIAAAFNISRYRAGQIAISAGIRRCAHGTRNQ